jgi:hypothetical protein
MTDLPIIPVYHYTDTMLSSPQVQGWERSQLGGVDFPLCYCCSLIVCKYDDSAASMGGGGIFFPATYCRTEFVTTAVARF